MAEEDCMGHGATKERLLRSVTDDDESNVGSVRQWQQCFNALLRREPAHIADERQAAPESLAQVHASRIRPEQP